MPSAGGGTSIAPGTRHQAPSTSRKARQRIARKLPSLSFHSGQRAGDLFAPASGRKVALARGVAMHADYEKVEWLEASEAHTDLERALVKPADCVALWREKAFELFVDGEWISGRFDRVVFVGEGKNRRAIVYDFKTSRRQRGESDAAFADRMRAAYAGQMQAYRRAVAAMTGLPSECISSHLLLTDGGMDVV